MLHQSSACHCLSRKDLKRRVVWENLSNLLDQRSRRPVEDVDIADVSFCTWCVYIHIAYETVLISASKNTGARWMFPFISIKKMWFMEDFNWNLAPSQTLIWKFQLPKFQWIPWGATNVSPWFRDVQAPFVLGHKCACIVLSYPLFMGSRENLSSWGIPVCHPRDHVRHKDRDSDT